jgi:hypothetical protein
MINLTINSQGIKAYDFKPSFSQKPWFVLIKIGFLVTTFTINSAFAITELMDFSVSESEKIVTLKWVTFDEIDNAVFEIQRSSDGVNFITIGKVSGKGINPNYNSYSFADLKPGEGSNFYRLKMEGYDGRFEYSPIRSIYVLAENYRNCIKFFPNPTAGNISVSIEGYKNYTMSLEVVNSNGYTKKSVHLKPNKKINLSDLPQGIYFMHVIDEDRNLLNIQRVVKLR